MKRAISILIALALVWALWQGVRAVFPPDELRIRQELKEIAKVASFSPHEGNLARVWKAQKLASFFSTNTSLQVDFDDRKLDAITSRDQLQQAILAARAEIHDTKLQLLDIAVDIHPGKIKATAEMTLLADVNGERAAVVQELQVDLEKAGRFWLIHQLRTRKPPQ